MVVKFGHQKAHEPPQQKARNNSGPVPAFPLIHDECDGLVTSSAHPEASRLAVVMIAEPIDGLKCAEQIERWRKTRTRRL